jgi:ribosomal protein S18 acetylase RimI-like enzyme
MTASGNPWRSIIATIFTPFPRRVGPICSPPPLADVGEVLESWSRKPDEARYQWMRQVIAQGGDIVLVAEEPAGIVGFGIVDSKMREVRALYVHPTAVRRGIGRRLLRELEAQAAFQGITCLQLNASLNADDFYRRNGYTPLSRGVYRLPNGGEMDCVRMEKIIP